MQLGDSLSIVNATKYYGKFKAVDNVSLAVNKGEFLTILGPSGSGKTSLLKLIAGFEGLSSGAILLNNQEITKKKAYEREIGMLFQNYALFPHMTVFDNIAYPLRLRKYPKREIAEKVSDILKLVHLEEYASRFPKQLSGGQQQRVALARAIVYNPPLLLLDEPLGALDKNLRHQMQLEIKHIQEKLGITTISVTHDQEEALTMSDRICVMNRGRIEQIDTPQNLYQKPSNRFVAEFIGEINLIAGELVGKEAGTGHMKLLNRHVVTVDLADRDELALNTSVYLAIRPENVQIAADQAAWANTLSAKVKELIYVGEAVKVKAEMETGQELTVKVPARDMQTVALGREVLLGWGRQDAYVIVDDQGR